MIYLICFLALILPHSTFTDARKPEELILSTPDQLARQDRLVGQLIGPLGGQLVLKQTDLVTNGAAPLTLNRYYIPPAIFASYHPKGGDADREYMMHHIASMYRGWVFMPQVRLQVLQLQPLTVRVTDTSGATLDFRLQNGQTQLITEPHGISNFAGDFPSGQLDPRNTQIAYEQQKVIVTSPDGAKRTYRRASPFYLLEKEQLPNGKVRRYEIDAQHMSVKSADPCEQHLYDSITMTGSPKLGKCVFQSSSGQNVTYQYDIRLVPGKWDQHKHQEHREFIFKAPPLLTAVHRPMHVSETIAYNERFLLDRYTRDDVLCQCQYGVTDLKSPFTVQSLRLPVGADDGFVAVHTLRYDAPLAKVRDGTTTVDNIDGTRLVYHYSKTFLPQKIEFFDADKNLHKQTLYEWTADQRLHTLAWADGHGYVLCRKTYDYDTFGNPIVETLSGDLTGCGSSDPYTIQRTFSTDGLHLCLREQTDTGKVLVYRYRPGTNLPIAKLTQAGDQVLYREFWEYDLCNNLVQTISDDGTGTEADDFTDVTVRTITSYTLRTEQPFLHLPEWTEEAYWEAGTVHLLKRTHHIYDAYGNVCQDTVYDANGQLAYELHHTYDVDGHLLSETNALGQTATYRYDDHGRCVYSREASGKVEKQLAYDVRGRLRQERETGCDGLEHTTTYSYDANDRLIETVDPLGNATRYTYDLVASKVASIASPAIPSLDGRPVVTQTHYDAFGRKIGDIDANGNATTLRSNAYGSPTQITHPDGSCESFVYTKSGKMQQHIDPSGLTTTYAYDALDRLVTRSCILAQETFVYRGKQLISETDKEGNTTHYRYDGAGRKIAEEVAGRTIRYGYDSLGRPATVIQENGKNTLVTHSKRDLLDRVVEVLKTDSEGHALQRLSYTYDAAGNRATTTHYRANSAAVETDTYDSFNRRITHTDALGQKTRWTYDESQCDALGQRILTETMTQPNGTQTIITYDPYDRDVKKEIRQLHATLAAEERFYDSVGNLLEHRDHIYRDGVYHHTQRIAYTHDLRNRVASVTRAPNSADERTTCFTYTPTGHIATKTLPSDIALHYAYDALGYLQSLTSSDGQIAFTYSHDRLGRLLTATDQSLNLSITRTLDAFGNVLTEQFPSGLTLRKTYDALDRPLSVAWSNEDQVTYHYDPLYLRSVQHPRYSHDYDDYDLDGNLQMERLMGGLGRVRHEVDLKGRKTSLTSPYFTQYCAYDAVDNLTQSMIEDAATDYSYDALDQLTEEATSQTAHSYHHDSHYNRIATDGVATQVNDLDELTSVGPIDCTYDLNGNLVTKRTPTATWNFTYDPLNRLTQATSGNCVVKMTYDPLGRRLSKITESTGYFGWLTIAYEQYLWDGENEIGAFSAQGTPKQVRTLGLATHRNVPSTVAIELDGSLYVPIFDCQGNICRLIDPYSQRIAESYQFDAFGQAQARAAYRNPWRYASKRFDPHLQLIYFGKRYYDPELARWLTADPADFVDSTNLYQYVLNNPFKYVDPTGENIFGFLCGIGQILAGGAIMASGVALEIVTFGGYTFAIGFHESVGLALMTSGCAQAMYHSTDINFEKRSSRPNPDPRAEGNPHTIIERPGPDGQYTTHNGDGTWKQYRGSGKPHGSIPRPNVKENENNPSPSGPIPGNSKVREPKPDEIPKGRA
jgi:RHS repeat-associated protein